MKNKGFNSRRFLLFAGVMLTLLHVGSVTAWGAKDDQGIAQVSDRGQRGIPPKAAKGISPERVEVISSLNPPKATSYDVYLDRFEIWTEDTRAVINALENPEYVKGVKRSYGGSWQISVNTGNPKTGKLLRDKLKNCLLLTDWRTIYIFLIMKWLQAICTTRPCITLLTLYNLKS